MSSQRAMPGGRADSSSLSLGAGGRPLCRWCNLEVPSGRRTFCSNFCVEEWRLRSDPGHLRQRVFERDRAVCAVCRLDCEAAFHHLRRLRGAARQRAENEWKRGLRQSLWEADHITPVIEGGGECDLSNMQTLCLKCHRLRTAVLRKRLRAAGRPVI